MHKKQIIVAVSGGFDPLHVGHVRMFKEAKRLGDRLIVILNNDNWVKAKKGYVFMPQRERKEIIEAIGFVDKVVYTRHKKNPKDMSVGKDLLRLKPSIFANGGDRIPGKLRIAEVIIAKKIGCKLAYNVGRGGKVQSSSWLLDKFSQKRQS